MGYRSILVILALIGGAIAADVLALDGAGSLFMAGKLAGLIEYMAVWR